MRQETRKRLLLLRRRLRKHVYDNRTLRTLYTYVQYQTRRLRAPAPANAVRIGEFRRLSPISRDFGFDRGQPIDRYYIERFLAHHSECIRDHVLEIKDDTYTRRFGGANVSGSDVLDIAGDNWRATIVADLTSAAHVPSDTYDCIIFTQTLHFIYDLRAAVQTLRRILKPGGVLLATFPGTSRTSCSNCGGYYYWSFTQLSVRRLFEESFPPENVKVGAYGNVLAAISFLHGLAAEELQKEELAYDDPDYAVIITLKATKPARS